MQLSKKVIHYLSTLGLPDSIKSNFLIADLEKIIYTATDYSDEYYSSKPLSTDLLALIEDWKKLPISEDIFFMENNSTKKIIHNDSQKYSAQMIFPLYVEEGEDKLQGLTIYFRNYGDYIKSSPKAPNTMRKWIMSFMGKEIFPIYKNYF